MTKRRKYMLYHGNAKRSGERITKKQLAKELDIQEDMLD